MEQSITILYSMYLRSSDLRPNSKKFKERSLKYFVEEFGDMAVGQVNAAFAEDYRNLLAKGRSKAAAKGYLDNFKPFWRWLQRHNYIQSNPFEGIRPLRYTEIQKETFTAEELGRLLYLSNRLWKVRICLGLLGMRRGEVMNLTVRELKIESTDSYILLSPKTKTEYTWPFELKNKQQRMVALPEKMCFCGVVVELHKEIIRLIEELRNGQPYICLEERYYQRMISNTKPEDWRTNDLTGNFQRSFNNLQKRAAISPTRRFHELRAAFITKIITMKGIDIASESAGHSTVEITRKYDRRKRESLIREIGQKAESLYMSNL